MKNTHRSTRHERNHARGVKKAIIILALVITGTIASALYLDYMSKNSPKPLSADGIPSNYSLQEMHAIWTNNFQDIFDKELLTNAYPLPKIQERFNLLTRLMQERYHTNLAVNLVTKYNAECTDVAAGCWITNGQPQLSIIIPKLVDNYYDARARGDKDWLLRVRDGVVASIMHEYDHLAFGLVAGTRQHPSSLNELVEHESAAWAQTCEYTLTPMIEEYHVPLYQSDYVYYHKWIEAGRDETNPLWKDFIRSVYKATRQ